MPTSSSLVTNLPADFNTFGQGVDTSLQDLLGGTTGQVLSKTSGTNMDFTWVTPTDQTPLTTKGDLFTFSTVDARLGVGTNGQTLVADSTASTGLKWATPSAGGKVLQVVSATTTTATTINTTTLTDTTITATITPTLASSKVLVIISASAYWESNTVSSYIGAKLLRGATDIGNWGSFGFGGVTAGGSYAGAIIQSSVTTLDAPASTSALTYKLQGRLETTANSSTSIWQRSAAPSTITLLEIGA